MQARRWPVRLPHNRRSTLGSARILLVEDDQRVAEATQDLLHNMGFDTSWAGDGPAALAFVENDPKLALVLSDVVMPGGVSGLDLARTLRDRRPELPVILTTGYSSHASEVVAEGFALIEKPYRRDVLAAVAPIGARKARPFRFRDTYRLLTIQKRLSVEVRDRSVAGALLMRATYWAHWNTPGLSRPGQQRR